MRTTVIRVTPDPGDKAVTPLARSYRDGLDCRSPRLHRILAATEATSPTGTVAKSEHGTPRSARPTCGIETKPGVRRRYCPIQASVRTR
jgi:hypothetical protein